MFFSSDSQGTRFRCARTSYNRHGEQTLSEVCSQTGITKSMLSDIESDAPRSVGHDKIAILAEYYGVSSDYLLGLSDCPYYVADLQAAQAALGLSYPAMMNLLAIKDMLGVSAFDLLNAILASVHLPSTLAEMTAEHSIVSQEIKTLSERLRDAHSQEFKKFLLAESKHRIEYSRFKMMNTLLRLFESVGVDSLERLEDMNNG